jgi:3-methyladenine DNA glycosylase AlkD
MGSLGIGGRARNGRQQTTLTTVDAVVRADEIEAAPRAVATPERAEGERAYLRSELVHLGATVPQVRRVALAVEVSGRAELLALAAALWGRGVHELRLAAVELLAEHAALLEPADLDPVEVLLREAGTWALVDPLAVQVVGSLVLAHPAEAERLDRWVDDADRWVRRAALLALLAGVRAGTPDLGRVARYADARLEETEPFIRKAIGWLLREVARRDPGWVIAWLEPRADRAPGLTIREALKHRPDDRARLLDRRRQRGRGAGGR